MTIKIYDHLDVLQLGLGQQSMNELEEARRWKFQWWVSHLEIIESCTHTIFIKNDFNIDDNGNSALKVADVPWIAKDVMPIYAFELTEISS